VDDWVRWPQALIINAASKRMAKRVHQVLVKEFIASRFLNRETRNNFIVIHLSRPGQPILVGDQAEPMGALSDHS
jgi:hypothetical protein